MMSLRILGFLVWEVTLLAAACRATRLFPGEAGETAGGSRFLSLTLLFDILIGSTIATVVTVARANGPWTYLGVAALLWAGMAARPEVLRDDLRQLGNALDRAFRTGTLLDRFLMLTLLAVALSACLKPVSEYDSQYMLSYLQRLLVNRSHIHPTPTSYVVFWELGYLPAMAFTRNDWFLWVLSLKPVLLAAIVFYQVGVEQGVTRSIAALAGVNAVLLCHYWLNCSGVGTVKNDMAHGAGVALMALVGLRVVSGCFNRETGALATVAAIFLTLKFSGLPATLASLGLIGVLAAPQMVCNRWRAARWAAWSAGAWLLTVGHYYVWNLVVHRNPLYPFPVQFGPLSFPGDTRDAAAYAELPRTTILSSLGDARVWDAFFHVNEVSIAGLWFPITLAAGLVASLAVMAIGLLAVIRRRPANLGTMVIAGLVGCFWLLYFHSYWSAHARPGDLIYLREHKLFSLRYAEGAVGLTELFLLALLARARCPAALQWSLLASSSISRIVIFYDRLVWGSLTTLLQTLVVLVPVSLLVLAVLTLLRSGRLKASLAVAGTVLALMLLVPARVEQHRERYWYSFWKPVWSTLHDLPPGRVFLVQRPDDFGKPKFELYRYVVQGGQFDRDVRAVLESTWLSGKAPEVDYVVYLREPAEGNERHVRDFDRRAAELGYVRVAGNADASLLRRASLGRVVAAARSRVVR